MPLDFSNCGYEHLFREALLNGISLFCGAGFSVNASDKTGENLPTGIGLLSDLQKMFPAVEKYTNLSRACTRILSTDKEAFYAFLKQRFSVETFDPLYLTLLQIKIKRIYTTNIDDLFFKIYESSEQPLYLNDCSTNGETYSDNQAVHYYPLHGCVQNGQDYVFGATEIASAFSRHGNEHSWKTLAADASHNPILFWGWNFEDAGPIGAMYGGGNKVDDNTNRWVLLRNPSAETIDYIKSLKFNIIIGDTAQMLEYLTNLVEDISSEPAGDEESQDTAEELKQYEIPANDTFLSTYPLSSFFLEYTPRWSHIYSGVIPKASNYKKTADAIASGSNTIIIGMRGSGKTTLLMQLLADLKTNKLKHILIAPSLEQAKTYIKLLRGRSSLLFIDDCFRDTNALIALLDQRNIQVVCADRDFNFERQFHKISAHLFTRIDITEITKEDAQSIVNIIPADLRKEDAGTKNFEKDPTILNLLASNLKSMNFKFFPSFYEKDPDAARVFLMISYVHSCGTPCSFDMVYSFLGDDSYTWEQMYEIVDRAGGLITDAAEWLQQYNIRDFMQDYYLCRSRFLAEKVIASIPRGTQMFADVLSDFAKYVPPYKICLYDKFKRSAYDADLAIRAFTDIDEGEAFYNLCSEKDDSEYIYQQAAIYFSRKKDYKRAFKWIDKSRNLTHYNRFSIDSTYAGIYFDVNLHANREQASAALDILSGCCRDDKRKSIHFATFAKCCLEFHKEYNDSDSLDYVLQALDFIDEGLDDHNLSLSKQNKWQLTDLNRQLKSIIESQ